MSALGRLGDPSHVPADAHECPACPHDASGPATAGSPDVLANDRAVLRVTDSGAHDACCGSNTWVAATGAPTVLINDLPAFRVGDLAAHCGGTGELAVGSDDVDVGDAGADAGAVAFVTSIPDPAPRR